MGDGTTASGRARRRWRRSRVIVTILTLLVIVAALSVLPKPHTSGVPLAPDNPATGGGRAVAQILGARGVSVHYVRTTAEAVAGAKAGTTLLLTNDYLLDDDQLTALAATGADLVLLEPSEYALDVLSDGRAELNWAGLPAGTTIDARCDDPDATAAGSITIRSSGLRALNGSGTVCFPGTDATTGSYLVLDGTRRLTALSSSEPVTNGALATAGNAALALRMLGRHDVLTWYVPQVEGVVAGDSSGPGLGDLLPPSAGMVAVQLLVVVVFVALWRGRRLGRLVTEPLPVVVRASEAVRGRGRLYRRSRSYGHASAALRAGAARRCAARLGLARSAPAAAVIDALSRATGRRTDDIAALLYGPPPTDDIGLAQLARELDELESEVHHP